MEIEFKGKLHSDLLAQLSLWDTNIANISNNIDNTESEKHCLFSKAEKLVYFTNLTKILTIPL